MSKKSAIKYWSFKKARKFVHQLGLKNTQAWRDYCDSKKLPKEIHHIVENFYEKEWQGMGDWLGTGNVASSTKSKNWLPLKDAKKLYQKIAKENNINSPKEWKDYVKTHDLPQNLPKSPELIYSEFKIKNENERTKDYRSFTTARKFVRLLKLKNRQAWRDYYQSGKLPKDIPTDPHYVYKEYSSIGDWLGIK